MGKPYSLDLRERICAYVAKGNSARSAGRLFGVSAATAVRFAAEHRHRGTAVPKPQGDPAAWEPPCRRVALPVSSASSHRIVISCGRSCRLNRTSHSRNWPPPCRKHMA